MKKPYTSLTLADLGDALEADIETARTQLVVDGKNMSTEEFARLCTVIVTAHNLTRLVDTATSMLANLMENVATPGAPRSGMEN